MPETRLDGRVAVVTGAGRGIGRATALKLAELGASVVVNDLGAALDGRGADEAPAAVVAREIEAAGGKAVANFDSVSEYESAGRIIQTAIDAFGRIDILVNNAGIVASAPIWEVSPELFARVVGVHLFGTFNCTRHACVHMKEQGWGRIVNLVSRAGLVGAPGSVGYGSGKGGIFGFTNVVARDLAPFGVNVNAVNPAATLTRMVEGSPGAAAVAQSPEDVAVLIAFLCSDAATVTGQTFLAQHGAVGWFSSFAPEKTLVKDGTFTVEELAAGLGRLEVPPLPVLYAPPSED
ncbi:MAG: SDR family NAD(P)-dependent oxidoreductase [Dehalococcoidia bacterium]